MWATALLKGQALLQTHLSPSYGFSPTTVHLSPNQRQQIRPYLLWPGLPCFSVPWSKTALHQQHLDISKAVVCLQPEQRLRSCASQNFFEEKDQRALFPKEITTIPCQKSMASPPAFHAHIFCYNHSQRQLTFTYVQL